MDFYCKVKLKQGGFSLLEHILLLTTNSDWIRKNASVIKDHFALFPAFGANATPYSFLIDLEHSASKALIRSSDHKIIFSGIPSEQLSSLF